MFSKCLSFSLRVIWVYHVKTVYQDDSCHTQEHEHTHICSSLCYSLDSTRWSFSGDKELFNLDMKLRKEILLGYCAKCVKLRQGGRTSSLPPVEGPEWAMDLSSTDTFPRGRKRAEYKYCRQWVTKDDVIDLCKDCRVWIWRERFSCLNAARPWYPVSFFSSDCSRAFAKLSFARWGALGFLLRKNMCSGSPFVSFNYFVYILSWKEVGFPAVI